MRSGGLEARVSARAISRERLLREALVWSRLKKKRAQSRAKLGRTRVRRMPQCRRVFAHRAVLRMARNLRSYRARNRPRERLQPKRLRKHGRRAQAVRVFANSVIAERGHQH